MPAAGPQPQSARAAPQDSGELVMMMMPRMVSAALVLLFLPLKACVPLEWPSPGTNSQNWEPWQRHAEWEDNPSASLLRPGEGFFQGHVPPRSCKPLEALPILQALRAERSPSSSKRREGRPNSLDLTFHLLREFLEMSREERLAQKARSNKILLHNIGK